MNNKAIFGLRATIPEPKTIDEMRKAIYEGSFDSPLIRHALNNAYLSGMSGEDKYAMLAYHALVELQRAHELLGHYIQCAAKPLIMEIQK